MVLAWLWNGLHAKSVGLKMLCSLTHEVLAWPCHATPCNSRNHDRVNSCSVWKLMGYFVCTFIEQKLRNLVTGAFPVLLFAAVAFVIAFFVIQCVWGAFLFSSLCKCAGINVLLCVCLGQKHAVPFLVVTCHSTKGGPQSNHWGWCLVLIPLFVWTPLQTAPCFIETLVLQEVWPAEGMFWLWWTALNCRCKCCTQVVLED